MTSWQQLNVLDIVLACQHFVIRLSDGSITENAIEPLLGMVSGVYSLINLFQRNWIYFSKRKRLCTKAQLNWSKLIWLGCVYKTPTEDNKPSNSCQECAKGALNLQDAQECAVECDGLPTYISKSLNNASVIVQCVERPICKFNPILTLNCFELPFDEILF